MQHWIDEEFENNFDFPDIFNSFELAIGFYHKFLCNQIYLKVLGIVLPSKYHEIFLEEQDDLRYEVCKNIDQSQSINPNNIVLGIEIYLPREMLCEKIKGKDQDRDTHEILLANDGSIIWSKQIFTKKREFEIWNKNINQYKKCENFI